MDERTTKRIKDAIAAERERTGVPEGFEDFPPIPARRYVDPAFFELEMDHVWSKSWLLAGHLDQLPDRGSYFLWEDSGRPIVVVRGRDGGVRAFYNTCKHRGAPVVREPSGTVQRFRCLYHSWTYDLDGELIGVPDRRDFGNLDFSRHRLSGVRCEVWGSFIFINEDPNATPLLESLGSVPAELEDWNLEALHFVQKSGVELECNWKVAVDAFLEVYHLKHIHPNTSHAFLDYTGSVMGLLPGGHSRMPSPIRESILVDGNVPSQLPDIPSVGEIPRITNLAYTLFPNLVTPLDPTGFPILLFWPLDIRRTRMDVLWFGPDRFEGCDGSGGPDGLGGKLPEAWKTRIRIIDMVLDEDIENLAWIQKSLGTPAFESIPLSYQERRIYHFHEQLDRVIGIEHIDESLRVAPRTEAMTED